MSSFLLKVMAILLMTLDHVYSFMPGMPMWFGYVGKLAAPIFFYLIVEGFHYTRDVKRYALRLFSLAAVMVGVDWLLNIQNNIFLSLGVGVLMMMVFDHAKQTKWDVAHWIVALVLSALMIQTEASIYGLGMILIFYFFRTNRLKLSSWYIAMCLSFVVPILFEANVYEQLFIFDYQWMMVGAVPFFLLYNGQLGYRAKWVQWAFYLYYPIHLITIVLLSKF